MTVTSQLPGFPPRTNAPNVPTAHPGEAPTPLAAAPNDHVLVNLTHHLFFTSHLGTAPTAARSANITDVERQTVLDIDRGARTLGLTGNGQPDITVTLRDTMAGSVGPYANGNKVGVPKGNIIASAAARNAPLKQVTGTGELFAYDVALHELGHVVQSQTMQQAGMQQLDADTRAILLNSSLTPASSRAAAATSSTSKLQEASGLREGLSDATAAVITHDWVIGEGYFQPGSEIRAVRDIAHPIAGDTMETVETDYSHARAGLDGTGPASRTVNGQVIHDNEGHSIGGIVSHAVYTFEKSQGWDAATQLVGTLQRDPALWSEGGTLEAFRDRFLATARSMENARPGSLDAARTALRSVGYTVSDTDTGSAAASPNVPTPVDVGPEKPGPIDPNTRSIVSRAQSVGISTGIGTVAGLALGGVVALLSPLNMKHGLLIGAGIGAALGAAQGVAANR